MKTYINSLLSEWQKTRKSAASWLVLIGGLFVPTILIIVQSFYPEEFSPAVLGENYWNSLFRHSWESTAILLLPVGVILATSMITQLEFRNNTWKQVFTTPQRFSTLFFSKLTVVIVMMIEFFIINLLGLFAAAYLPGLWSSAGYPPSPPLMSIAQYNMLFFVASLPLLAWQFMISMRFRNFLVSIGVGIGLVMGSLFAFSWKYGYQFPFAHTGLVYAKLSGQNRTPDGIELWMLSLIWFVVITIIHYILYIAQKERVS
jgi:hypothetical protein